MRKTAKTADKTTPGKAAAARHSEETNLTDHQGYNEVNPDAPVNPDQQQKKAAREMKDQLPPATD